GRQGGAADPCTLDLQDSHCARLADACPHRAARALCEPRRHDSPVEGGRRAALDAGHLGVSCHPRCLRRLRTCRGTTPTHRAGNLEWQAMQAAESLRLAATETASVTLRRLVLGRELGQCCGGVVQLWLERFTHLDLPLLRRAAGAISGGGCAAIVTEFSREGA